MRKKLRVGLDLTMTWRTPTGMVRYALELARHLIVRPDAEITYIFFCPPEIPPMLRPLQQHFIAVRAPWRNELLTKQLWFPWILKQIQPDLIHFPTLPPPWFTSSSARHILTFHDATPWRYPETLTLHGLMYFRYLLKRGIKQSEAVIAVSNHARLELGALLSPDYLQKTSVIPEAAGAQWSSEPVITSVRPTPFFLYLGTLEPRKNLVRLLNAYVALRSRTINPPDLLLVGRRGWRSQPIIEALKRTPEGVHWLGHLPDQQLHQLYRQAVCLVLPSLYEGFGLPILEAMASGCPVICSRSSSLPEIAGNAACMIDPLDENEITEALERLWHCPDLRGRLKIAGKARAESFTWERTASLTRELYL